MIVLNDDRVKSNLKQYILEGKRDYPFYEQLFKKYTTLDIPKGLPYVPDYMKLEYKLVNNKVILPSVEELSENNRSHSAKLRAIEKI